MNYFTGCCLSFFLVTNCFAEEANPSLPPGFVKISKDNNPKCVVYMTYKGDMYCSEAEDKTPIDPAIMTYEKQNIQFDSRAWKAAWGKKEGNSFVLEYVPSGEDINSWNELITSQLFMDLKDVTPEKFYEQFINNLKQSGVVFTTHIIDNQPNQFIYEFRVQQPANLQQDEIQKITKTKDGIYVLHYVKKGSDMGEENRNKWIENLKKSSLKEMSSSE